jgi:hypothetical protein
VKILFDMVAVIPASFLVAYLKRAEGVDVYDYSINFNPFGFNIQTEQETTQSKTN